jgi:hypothetical protein
MTDPALVVDESERTQDDRDICEAWSNAYETYLWSYLVKGPSISAAFGRGETFANSHSSVAPDAIDDLTESVDPPSTPSERPWERSLIAPLSRIQALVARNDASKLAGKFARACAWQAVTNVRDTKRVPESCVSLVDKLALVATTPAILRRISDINASLRIPKDAFPTYTLQLTVDVNFERLSTLLLKNAQTTPVAREQVAPDEDALARQARLLCLGPVPLRAWNDATSFHFRLPLRVRQREDGADWNSQRIWTAEYDIDTSNTNSTLRFDFSLKKPASPAPERLLDEDRGYFLMRKKAGYVNATEIIVERSLWFANMAYTMNATLMPLFRMIVESRVLQELSKVIDASPPSVPPPSGSRPLSGASAP